MRNLYRSSAVAIIMLALILIGIISHRRTIARLPVIEPENFEQCALIYPVLETYPEQCNTPSGKHFVHELPKVSQALSPATSATSTKPVIATSTASSSVAEN